MKKIELTTVTFEADYGFMIDIVDNANAKYPTWDVWLYRKDYGIKEYMFGLPKDRTSNIDAVVAIVESNLEDHSYYSNYDDEYAQDADREYEDECDDDDDEYETFEVAVDEWKHVPAKGTVDSGFGYSLTAPSDEGFYTLYEQYDCDNNHLGWRWEKETV